MADHMDVDAMEAEWEAQEASVKPFSEFGFGFPGEEDDPDEISRMEAEAAMNELEEPSSPQPDEKNNPNNTADKEVTSTMKGGQKEQVTNTPSQGDAPASKRKSPSPFSEDKAERVTLDKASTVTKRVRVTPEKPLPKYKAKTVEEKIPREKYNRIPTGNTPYVQVTDKNGERLYFPIQRPKAETAVPLDSGSASDPTLALGAKPISDLVEEIERELMQKAMEASKRSVAEARRALGDFTKTGTEAEGSSSFDRKPQASSSGRGKGKRAKSTLWPDKYAPERYADLLTDPKVEPIHRAVLRWVKQWDQTVFGKAPKKSQVDKARDAKGLSRTALYEAKPRKQRKKAAALGSEEEEHVDTRPGEKIILLHGPPGLGKTTLAHVVARQCGYRPVEINASDNRAGSVLVNRIRDATEFQSVSAAFDGDYRPNLLIIDEIDGAWAGGGEGGNAIKVLLDLAYAEDKQSKKAKKDGDDNSDDEGDEKDAEKAKKGKKKKQRLSRPIICICNDPYKPVLRPLREKARLFGFIKPSPDRLALRLREICTQEGLKAPVTILRKLCDLTDGDIRSCLNTLQFVRKKTGVLTPSVLDSLAIGHKDITKSQFDIWKQIFAKPHTSSNSISDSDKNHVTSLYNMLVATGEHDRILDGCHHNFLTSGFSDPSLSRVVFLYERLEYADMMMAATRQSQIFALNNYVPISVLSIHRLCRQNKPPRIQFPSPAVEHPRRRRAHRNIIDTVVSSTVAKLQPYTHAQVLVLDVSSHLLTILAPAVRPVNSSLFNEREQKGVNTAVGAMVCYHLQYVEHQVDQDRTAFRLEPPLNLVTTYEDFESARRRVPHVVKAAIRRRVLKEEIVRSEEGAAKPKASNVPPQTPAKRGDTGLAAEHTPAGNKTGDTPNPLSADVPHWKKKKVATPSTASPACRVVRDFFGRVVRVENDENVPGQRDANVAADTSKDASKTDAAKRTGWGTLTGDVLYRFQEGFTNAVKRPVKVSELL